MLMECLFCSRYFAKCFTCITYLIFLAAGIPVFPFDKEGSLKIRATLLISGGASI